jgi:hypothetical protein
MIIVQHLMSRWHTLLQAGHLRLQIPLDLRFDPDPDLDLDLEVSLELSVPSVLRSIQSCS